MEIVQVAGTKRGREADELDIVDASATKRQVVPRTSSLEAPTMLLTGHADAINTLKYSPDGQTLASGSADRHIFLWNAKSCANTLAIKGHSAAITDLSWTYDGSQILSCSVDKTVRCWDAETGEQVKKMKGHKEIVNSLSYVRRGPPLLVSASDDSTVLLWDLRAKGSQQTIAEKFAVTAVVFSDGSDRVFTGSIDNEIRCWDLRKNEVAYSLAGHTDTITGLALSPDGSYLLSNAMDNTLRSWDVRPYAPDDRCVAVYTGHAHSFEKNLLRCAWSADGRSVTCGSANREVFIWAADTKALQYRLPGHKGSVNEVAFSPIEPIVASCSSDKTIFVGELAG